MVAASSVVMQPLPTMPMSAKALAAMDVSDMDMVAFLRQCLLNSSMPIALCSRAILSLRNRKGVSLRQALVAAISDESSLLAHDAAFLLGQMQDP